jgi:hypothetical protein
MDQSGETVDIVLTTAMELGISRRDFLALNASYKLNNDSATSVPSPSNLCWPSSRRNSW